MIKRIVYTLVILSAITIVLDACKQNTIDLTTPVVTPQPVTATSDPVIQLNWFVNDTETKEEFLKGLLWGFLYLGAETDREHLEQAITWHSSTNFTLDFSKAGFTEAAQTVLIQLLDQYRATEEYTVNEGFDAGRMIVSLFNNSHHYYQIVGMPQTLALAKSEATFGSVKGAIKESGVAFGERIIHLPDTLNWKNFTYLAEELAGSIQQPPHKFKEFEIKTLMPNGMFKFGVYSANGQLINGSDPKFSAGGKPAKCLWCHEVNIQQAFAAKTSIPGYLSIPQFDSIVQQQFEQLKKMRSQHSGASNFLDKKEHTELEKMYIRFLEPSAERLAREWGISVADVQEKLRGVSTHKHDEFPEMGTLYHRRDVTSFSPFKTTPSTDQARENVGFQPNLLL